MLVDDGARGELLLKPAQLIYATVGRLLNCPRFHIQPVQPANQALFIASLWVNLTGPLTLKETTCMCGEVMHPPLESLKVSPVLRGPESYEAQNPTGFYVLPGKRGSYLGSQESGLPGKTENPTGFWAS